MAFSRFRNKANENRKKNKKCRLCLEEKTLIKKSHIIPEFMYQELFDEHHQIRSFAPEELLKEKPIIRKPSSGQYEGGLLCANCDNRVIGQYEDYASKVLYSKKELPKDISWYLEQKVDKETGLAASHIANIDYAKFKLFILSILWRASICTRDFFSSVDLGPYEESLRKMILNGDMGKENEYCFVITSWRKDITTANDIIFPPIRSKPNGKVMYTFPINGLLIDIYFSVDNIPEKFKDKMLKEDGTMTIIEIPPGVMKDLFLKLIK